MPVVYLMLFLLAVGAAFWAAFIALLAVGLAIVPAVLGFIAFWVAFNFWIHSQLESQPAVSQSLDLKVEPSGLFWSLNSAKLPAMWPYAPLAASVAVGLAIIGIEILLLNQNEFEIRQAYGPSAMGFVNVSGAVAAVGLCIVPYLVAARSRSSLANTIHSGLVNKVAERFRSETALLRNIINVEEQIVEVYASIGLHPSGTAQEACRELLLKQALGSDQDVRTELNNILVKVTQDANELRSCAMAYENARSVFEEAKFDVLEHGSSTLLEELDNVQAGLNSGSLIELFEDRKWKDLDEILGLIISELQKIKNAAAGGKSFVHDEAIKHDGEMPTCLEDAYAVLNVHAGTSKEVIKKLVTALRQTWHPDHTNDVNEKKFRTTKTQQINVAWKIVADLHPLP
jgi:hypothetical protein